MEKNTSPYVVMVADFVRSDSELFGGYINYIDRDEAIRKNSYRLFDMYAYTYMDNIEKTSNSIVDDPETVSALFTTDKNKLSLEDKNTIKKQFKLAQINKSPMWQIVFSYDKDFLVSQNILDEQGLLDESALQKATRNAMQSVLKNEKMESSAIWTASIHYNTDNIHTHIAMVEPYPTRKKIIYKGKEQFRGKLKPITLVKAKSSIINTLCNPSEELEKVNHFIRNVLISDMKLDMENTKQRKFKSYLKQIKKSLPEDKRLWKYNMNAINKDTKQLINNLTDYYINTYHSQAFDEFRTTLNDLDEFYLRAYGKNNKIKYSERKIDDMYTRMGNTVLTYLRQEEMKKTVYKSKNKSKKASKHKSSISKSFSNFKFNNDLKKAMKKDFTSIKNMRLFDELQKEIEISLNNSEPSIYI